MTDEGTKIGDVARRLGVSTRTLRYYEEVGLVTPAHRSAGGTRRYSEADLARVVRVRELQALMGFNLDEIRELLAAADGIEELRSEFRGGVSKRREIEIVTEAARLNAHTRAQVSAKVELLTTYLETLEADAARYRAFAKERGVDLDEETNVRV